MSACRCSNLGEIEENYLIYLLRRVGSSKESPISPIRESIQTMDAIFHLFHIVKYGLLGL